MPRTICSDFSHHNISVSNSQDFVEAGLKKKRKRIDKRKGHLAQQPKKQSYHKKNIILNRKLCKKLVYSPEYEININEVETPLYHSDQYQPSIQASDTNQHRYQKFSSYVTAEVLLKLYQQAQEEKQEKKLVQEMRAFKISPLEEEIMMQ